MHTRDRVVGDNEFVQRVRKYRPGSLLPLIAATSARYKEELWWRPVRPEFPSYRPYRPWALAEVARVSLAHGSEFQRKDATPQDLERLLSAAAARPPRSAG